jgi:PIN domain nuclease of toxin-antitoxin system
MNSNKALLLDTHIWLRLFGVSGKLRSAAIPTIEAAAAASLLYVSVISIWEIALLARQGRLNLQPDVLAWSRDALSQPGINLLPLSPEIAIDSVKLPEPMHKDPSDRILVASARVERLTLVTRDKLILDFAAATKLSCLQA